MTQDTIKFTASIQAEDAGCGIPFGFWLQNKDGSPDAKLSFTPPTERTGLFYDITPLYTVADVSSLHAEVTRLTMERDVYKAEALVKRALAAEGVIKDNCDLRARNTTLEAALKGLNQVIDAFWNDPNQRSSRFAMSERHTLAITYAQRACRQALGDSK